MKTYNSKYPSKLLRLSISDQCNLNCIYCCWASKSKIKLDNPFSVSDYHFITQAAVQSEYYKRVMITGGEPLLLNDFFLTNLIKTILSLKNKGLDALWICTNGTLLKEKARVLAEAGLENIDVSLSAYSAEGYNRYTRESGYFFSVLEGIFEAAKHGIAVRIAVPVFRGGIDTYEKLMKLVYIVEYLGAKSLGYFQLHKTKENAAVFPDLFIPVAEITETLRKSSDWKYLVSKSVTTSQIGYGQINADTAINKAC